MLAIQLKTPLEFLALDEPEPTPPAAGEALVRVHAIGICGTDISGYLGRMPFFSYPRIPGHELGVEVLAVGAGVENVRPGDHCCVEPYINDPSSFASKAGRPNCCNGLQVLGVHRDGGMRERFVLPARKLHVSTKLSWEQLALVETLAIGRHAVERSQAQPGQTVLIIGAGPIGLSVLEFVKLCGARPLVLDVNADRLKFCRETMGVEHTLLFKGAGEELNQLKDLTSGELASVVIDATGNSESMSHCLNYAAHGGRVVYVGITTQEVHFPHPLMHTRELTLMASRNALPADFGFIIQAIEGGRIDTTPWITHRMALKDVPAQFESVTKPENKVIKAMVGV